MKRVPAPKKNATTEAIPAPDKYPFGQLIGVLQSDTPQAKESPALPASEKVPADFNPLKDVHLPTGAKDALAVSQAWMAEAQTPAPGKDGRVLYTYGGGLPTLVCAPLRVCVIELEPGERILGGPQIGDSIRWLIAPASAGAGDTATAMIVVKPKAAGLDTNLLVTTDRRAYYLRLISKPEEYLARIAFSYPENELMKWKAHAAEEADRRRREAERIAPVTAIEDLYFDYRVLGDGPIKPRRVFDDGKKTFIQMSAMVEQRELPALVVIGGGGPEMVNYRVKDSTYIVDRIFDRGALILGAGKKAERVEIIRGTYRGKVKSKTDPYGQALGSRP